MLNVLDAQQIVLVVHLIINVIIVKMDFIFMEVLVIMLVQLVLYQIKIHSNVFHATVHAELVLIIQVHVQAASQEKDIYKFQEQNKNVLKNVLKELSLKKESVKFVISDVQNVWVLQKIVLLVLLVDIFTMLLVGIIAQVLLMQMENVLMNAHQDIGDLQTKNANNVHQNVIHAVAIQHA